MEVSVRGPGDLKKGLFWDWQEAQWPAWKPKGDIEMSVKASSERIWWLSAALLCSNHPALQVQGNQKGE